MNVKTPLFPLKVVLFPGGLIPLRIFEKRYVDMIRNCLRDDQGFGIVASINVGEENSFPFAKIGVRVKIIDTDVSQPGLFNIRCIAVEKISIISAKQQEDGLWIGDVHLLEPENEIPLPDDLINTKIYFEQLLASLKKELKNESLLPFEKPYLLNSCNWLANRWCEILDIPLDQKQKMLELDSPLLRLDLINDILSNEDPLGD
ncbi:MAG: peptidase S16 [Methylophilaceae bacterium]|jgi:Lon protease-like protein|nr:peptidase S16 [Methylophilaceae bacterium]NCA26593.1 peptidase S16 [Methylophilaceae bacterium]